MNASMYSQFEGLLRLLAAVGRDAKGGDHVRFDHVIVHNFSTYTSSQLFDRLVQINQQGI
jgi:hypothetical protein